jgi:Amt family ammonium transporter
MLLGLSASVSCYSFIALAKHRLRLDDSLDVFGIHGLGGIVGSIGTAIVALPLLGGHGGEDYSLGAQLGRQIGAVLLAIGWSAAGSAICFGLTRLAVPLRRDADEEREGLDLSEHGERAYNP